MVLVITEPSTKDRADIARQDCEPKADCEPKPFSIANSPIALNLQKIIALNFQKYSRLREAIQCTASMIRNQARACAVDDRSCANIAAVNLYSENFREARMHILWVITIGFVAGIIARLLAPGPNNSLPHSLGRQVGWYRPDQGAGLIGAVVGALIVLFIWHRLVSARAILDPGARRWL